MWEKVFVQVRDIKGASGPISVSLGNSIVLSLILAAGYFILGRVAFFMAISEGSATSVAFLPQGLALTFTILFGSRVGLGILVGQFILSCSLGVPAIVGTSFGLVNMVEGCIGGRLFWLWRMSPTMGGTRDVASFLALSAFFLQPAAAAVKAIPRLVISPPDTIFHLSLYSWAGNTMGQLLLTPLLLAWCSTGFRFDGKEIRRGLLIVGLYFLGILIFKAARLGEIDPLYWLAIFGGFYLVLIWIAVQSRTLTTALTNFLTTMGLLWVITSSPDSLLYFSTQDRVLYADILILGGIVTSLLISSLFGQLKERTDQLRMANEAKEKIFAVIGHDLRSPIASLKTALDLLGSGTMKPAQFREFQQDLESGVDHARWTLENLMEWSALQLDQIQPLPSQVSLEQVAGESISLFALQAEIKHVKIDRQIPAEAMIVADRQQVASVIRNILSNALKFSHEGSKVSVSAVPERDTWRLSIRDYGVGMSPERVRELFGAGREISSTLGTSHERGLGLGLQITSDFVRANHGSILVESQLGQGTVFHISLPTTAA